MKGWYVHDVDGFALSDLERKQSGSKVNTQIL